MPATVEPTEIERKEWWLYIYAHTSFEKALECCRLIEHLVDSTQHPLYLPLAVAMHAFYGRPFKAIHGINKGKRGIQEPRIPADFIPAAAAGLHKTIITFRDKILLHTDADEIPEAGRPLHDVVYHVENGTNKFSTNDPRPELKHYQFAARLLEDLIQKTICRIHSFHERFEDLIPLHCGDFQLNITGPLFADYIDPSPTLRFKP